MTQPYTVATAKSYVCKACGSQAPSWFAQCPKCAAWSSMVAASDAIDLPTPSRRPPDRPPAQLDAASANDSSDLRIASALATGPGGGPYRAPRSSAQVERAVTPERPPPEPVRITDVASSDVQRTSCGIAPFDFVLGGGFVAGSYLMLSGDPGAGKSTLLVAALAGIAKLAGIDDTVLYVTGEESINDVAGRARRCDAATDRMLIVAETDIDRIAELALRIKPRILAVDSIQMVHAASLNSPAGSIAQVTECAKRLMGIAKGPDKITTLLICHINKDGAAAGPKTLEHLVDVTLMLETGNAYARLGHIRFLRARKNRHGNTGAIGAFEMTGKGLVPSDVDPSENDVDRDGVFEPIAQELLNRFQALGGKVDDGLRARIAGALDFNQWMDTRG